MSKIIKPELLAPAGNLEKLKTALFYGADAVYIGLKNYSLRARESEFKIDDIKEAVEYTHSLKKKIYLAINIFAENNELNKIENQIKKIKNFEIDALIISDPALLKICKKILPDINLHLSTQTNINNWMAVDFWNKNGIKRINLARELNFKDIKGIRNKTKTELEIFVHGAMCMAYSGRCSLSTYMSKRPANKGLCSHPCRWKYYLVEENRPGEKYIIQEDDRGTYIFNSKDLCMIEYIPEMTALNLDSWKVEGRMKTSYYLAVVIKAYREAIDLYFKNPKNYKYSQEWLKELKKVSHRDYCTGFYLGNPDKKSHNYDSSGYIKDHRFVGLVSGQETKDKKISIKVRNKIEKGQEIELIMPPHEKNIKIKVDNMVDKDNKIITTAQNGDIISIDYKKKIPNNIIIRMKT